MSSNATPSSNEQQPIHPNMPASPSITLILAATPSLGIGKSGTLPWPQLRQEMAYFARVTKRVSNATTATQNQPPNPVRRINAVLMGRKTWDSIPPRFRPLKDRLNVVVTRSPGEFAKTAQDREKKGEEQIIKGPIVVSSLADALSRLQNPISSTTTTNNSSIQEQQQQQVEISRIFVIGGASIYRAALDLPQTKHVLLTKIKEEFECDTFFPVELQGSKSWRETRREELEEFVGEKVDGEIEEKGVKFEFCLFERAEVERV